MSEKNKAEKKAAKAEKKQEYVENLKKKNDYADAAFKKKVTIFNGCLLLVFIIGVCAVIFFGWYNRQQENKRYDELQERFKVESNEIKSQLKAIDEKNGSHEDKRKVKIEVTDENFSNWVGLLDSTYNCTADNVNYAAFGGAEIHLQGMFVTRKFTGGREVFWVYRNHHHDHEDGHEHAHEEEEAQLEDGELSAEQLEEMIPIEVLLADGQEAPENGTWVDVVGVVGPDTFKSLSGIREAVITVMTEPGQEYIDE